MHSGTCAACSELGRPECRPLELLHTHPSHSTWQETQEPCISVKAANLMRCNGAQEKAAGDVDARAAARKTLDPTHTLISWGANVRRRRRQAMWTRARQRTRCGGSSARAPTWSPARPSPSPPAHPMRASLRHGAQPSSPTPMHHLMQAGLRRGVHPSTLRQPQLVVSAAMPPSSMLFYDMQPTPRPQRTSAGLLCILH